MKISLPNHRALGLLGATTILAVFLAALRSPAADWAVDSLAGIVALIGVALAGARLALGAPTLATRRLWQLALLLLGIASIAAFAGPWTERIETRLGIDNLNDCLFLLATLAALWFVTRLEHFPAWARSLVWAGFALQAFSTLVDLGDSGSLAARLGPDVVEAIRDLSAFLSLQLYVAGAAMFVLRVIRLESAPDGWAAVDLGGAAAGGQPGDRATDRPGGPLGRRARLDLRRYVLRGTLRRPFNTRFYVEAVRPVMFLIRTLWCLWRFGRAIAAAGRPLALQAIDMLRLGWGEGIDPILYPTLELYRPERRNWADHALSRYEIGTGLLRRLHKVQPKPHGERVNLGDKLAFHACCRAHGLPTPRILIHASAGVLGWLEAADEAALDRDLFIKPRQWRGARGSLWLRRMAPFTWRTKQGAIWDRALLFDHLRRASLKRDMLLQEMLSNHPAIADLAEQSLIALRVITCAEESGAPVTTHAMLRVISKLEPAWHSKREHAAIIDLATGRLGRMCNDKDLWPGCWSDRHPVTGAQVTGRVLPDWPQIRALAEQAQRVFADRMLVGWDIALTPSGPVILEGNSYPDVHFLQRVHERPIGLSPLGPHLRRALDAARRRDRHMT